MGIALIMLAGWFGFCLHDPLHPESAHYLLFILAFPHEARPKPSLMVHPWEGRGSGRERKVSTAPGHRSFRFN
jgi:hypothetical protein